MWVYYIPVLENVFMEDHLYNHHLSLSCVPVAQHKHHESRHQTLCSLWGAQTRRNQSSWLIVDWWNCDTDSGISVQDYLHEIPRAPFTPTAPSTENNKSGAVQCEQCLSITSSARILKHCMCRLYVCVHVLTSYSS